MKVAGDFYYLATPYTRYPEGKGAAFEAAVAQAGLLLRAGVLVLSPIAHTHPIAEKFAMAGDFETWARFDRALIEVSRGVIVCRLPGWEISVGMAAEEKLARELGKPVVVMLPGLVPLELLEGRP